MNPDDFTNLEHPKYITPELFRFVQTEIIEMNSEQLGISLGFPKRKAASYINELRTGAKNITPPIVTALWYLVHDSGHPKWYVGP